MMWNGYGVSYTDSKGCTRQATNPVQNVLEAARVARGVVETGRATYAFVDQWKNGRLCRADVLCFSSSPCVGAGAPSGL